jgi:hypothetical protein
MRVEKSVYSLCVFAAFGLAVILMSGRIILGEAAG